MDRGAILENAMGAMNELSLFTGAGGGLLGGILLGWHPVGYVEWDDYCQRVIKARIEDGILPEAPIFGDIRTFISEGYAASYKGMVDVITGGFPCQDISCAGNRAGITGERSGLWSEMAETIRIVRPRYILVENSPMLTIRGLGTVLGDLAEMGFDARWGVFSASNEGRDILRERIFIAGTSQGHGRNDAGGAIKDSGNMGRYRQAGSPVDRYLEELERQGEQCATGREGGLPPYLCRVANGVDHRLDRLKAIGNGQVPQVVRRAWEILNESD